MGKRSNLYGGNKYTNKDKKCPKSSEETYILKLAAENLCDRSKCKPNKSCKTMTSIQKAKKINLKTVPSLGKGRQCLT